jgi:hypothetical protein
MRFLAQGRNPFSRQAVKCAEPASVAAQSKLCRQLQIYQLPDAPPPPKLPRAGLIDYPSRQQRHRNVGPR